MNREQRVCKNLEKYIATTQIMSNDEIVREERAAAYERCSRWMKVLQSTDADIIRTRERKIIKTQKRLAELKLKRPSAVLKEENEDDQMTKKQKTEDL